MPDYSNQLARLKIMWNCAVCHAKVEAAVLEMERRNMRQDEYLDIPACEDCEKLFAQLGRAM